MEALLYSAAGNRFAVLDGFERPPAAHNALALELCERLQVDGLLIGTRPRAGGDLGLLIYNRDGSRAEISGNGLRCLARWARESGHVRDDVLVIETDAGTRRVTLLRQDGALVGARAELGVPRIVEREAALLCQGRELVATLVDLGNPHCVLFVEDVAGAGVETLGPALERHERFPQRANVSFAEISGERLRLRTWERGVGETASCGSGASAAAAAAIVLGRARSPVAIETRGGRLEVGWDGKGTLLLAGPVERLATASRK